MRQSARRKRRHAQRSVFISQLKRKMTYIEQFEAELTKKLAGAEDTATIVRCVSEKV